MGDELQQFEIVMDQLRKAGSVEGIAPAALAEIRARFDAVVRSKNEFLLSDLEGQRNTMIKLADDVQAAITTIEYYVANFPLQTLRNVGMRLGNVASAGAGAPNGPLNIPAGTNTPRSPPPIQPAPTQPPIQVTPGKLKIVEVQSKDLDALCRVAQSEVGHFLKYGRPELEGGLRAVVDTIINRCAHAKYPDSIQAVVDQPYQFSAINAIGTWAYLPTASTLNAEIVTEHVRRRSEGAPSTIVGATHFLNPYLSSASAMASWGKFVVDNAVARFGNDQAHDVHYHGYAPNVSMPTSYLLVYLNRRLGFTGQGLPIAASALQPFRSLLIKNCLEQWEYFKRGVLAEDSDPQYLQVGKYWSVLGIPYDGRTKILNDSTGTYSNPPWSSAFISFIVSSSSNGSPGFRYAQAHCHYVQDFVSGRNGALFAAEHPDHYVPQPGDILHFGRDAAASYSFAEARARYLADSYYASHSDIVVEVDASTRTAKTIGGNVSQSVGIKTVALLPDGRLQKRTDGNVERPWIAILRALQ